MGINTSTGEDVATDRSDIQGLVLSLFLKWGYPLGGTLLDLLALGSYYGKNFVEADESEALIPSSVVIGNFRLICTSKSSIYARSF